jgi:hypothetical protein
MRCSSCSRVAASSLNANRGTVWLSDTSTSYNPYAMLSDSCTRRADGHGPPTDLRQPLHPTTPVMGDDNVDAFM